MEIEMEKEVAAVETLDEGKKAQWKIPDGMKINPVTNKMKINQASEITGIGHWTIRRAIHRGELKANKYSKEFLIEPEELIRWYNQPFAPKKKEAK